MVLGAVMLVDSPMPEMRIHWGTAIALALPFAAITVLLLTLVVRARRNKVVTGSEGMIGRDRRRRSRNSRPMAKSSCTANIGMPWRRDPVTAGARVRVTAIDKLKLTVEPFEITSGD